MPARDIRRARFTDMKGLKSRKGVNWFADNVDTCRKCGSSSTHESNTLGRKPLILNTYGP
jgi:hypothetical protein